MKRIKLGLNIDHVATIRNARGEKYPDPLKAALFAEQNGADSITIHLREDRRHIRDYDLINIKKKIKVPLNLEIAPTLEMLKIVLKHKPNFVCIVPEKRSEITTEGGLNLNKKRKFLKNMIRRIKNKGIRVSLFIEPKINDVAIAKQLDADCVELHTGRFCNLFNNNENIKKEFLKIKKSAEFAKKIFLEVHAGHGLTYKSTIQIAKIKSIQELNIGHFIIAESIFVGLKETIKNFKIILKK